MVCSICDADKAPEDSAILRSLAKGRQSADGIIYSTVFSAENLVANSLSENETRPGN